jgi:hypothetical protein
MRFALLFFVLALSFAAGCERRISKESLGTVVFEIPSVPGSEKPPPMKELEGLDDSREAPPDKGN